MTFSIHFKALLWKNWLLWKRKKWASLWELLTPIIMVGIIIGIRQTAKHEVYQAGNRIKEGVGYADPGKLDNLIAFPAISQNRSTSISPLLIVLDQRKGLLEPKFSSASSIPWLAWLYLA